MIKILAKDIAEIRFIREALRRNAQLAINIATTNAKYNYNKRYRQVEFEVGDKVWLALRKAYKLPSLDT